MRYKRQNGPGAGRDLKAEVPDQITEPPQEPSDFALSDILSDDILLKLFSRYNNKITQLERKMKSLESELEADPRESSLNSTDSLFLSEQDGKEDQDSQKDEHWPDGRPNYNPWSMV